MEEKIYVNELVKKRVTKEKELKEITSEYEKKKKALIDEINEFLRLEGLSAENLDINKIKIAESLLFVIGNIYGKTSLGHLDTFKPIAILAIEDIGNDLKHLKKEYFGNKRYEGYYQRSDHPYPYGPKHGSIVDKIGLKDPKKDLTNEEKDACIYFLQNYEKIKNEKND